MPQSLLTALQEDPRCSALIREERILWETKVSLKNLTSFRTGGEASWVLYPADGEACSALLACLKAQAPLVLGKGSNVLAPDEGLCRPLILTRDMKSIRSEGTKVIAEAGVPLSRLASELQRLGLQGGEFLYGIPGSVGGAVRMNAGAYDHAMEEILLEVCVCNPEGRIYTLSKEEAKLSYRHSRFRTSGETVLSATLQLQQGDREQIRAVMETLMERRRSKQPLEYPSAGSYFKRPPGHFAGKLIEDCGLKGYAVGDARISEKHAGFLINGGNAATKDILAVEEHVRSTVWERFGIRLECEVEKLREPQ